MVRILLLALFIAISSSYEMDAQTTADTLQGQGSIGELQAKLADGYHSEGLYEQLGYAYYHQGDLGRARLYYEKAHLQAPMSSSITESLSIIREELEVPITLIPDFILVRMWRQTAKILSPVIWSVLQVLTVGVILVLLYNYWIKRRDRSISWTLLGSLLVLTIFFSLLAYQSKVLQKGGAHAVVMDTSDLHASPDKRSEVLAPVGPGNKILILDQIDDWVKVELADKDIGWLPQEFLEVI